MRMARLAAVSLFALAGGCTTANDVLNVPVAETIGAKDAQAHFNARKLAGVEMRFDGDTGIFQCPAKVCGEKVAAFFQMATLTQEQQETLAVDKAKGYADLSNEVSSTFILPGDGTPQSYAKSAPILASSGGVTAMEQTVVSRDPSIPGPQTGHVIILADRGQSSIIIALAQSQEAATAFARKLRAAWRP
jgi:uncharacterized protein (DUF2147 family)